MKRAFWIVLAVAVGISLVSVGLARQAGGKQKSEATKAVKAGKLRGSDPNVKHPGETNNAATPKHAVAPKGKSGVKARGAYATVHVDNRTGWIIKIYDTGTRMGTVGSYGDFYYYAEPGTHILYGVADFDDGSRKTWGPRTISVDDDETFTWHLDD